ncbi:hypothetical protein [Kamptonema formosum]|uniref:hypothetical protein n=1 Tax=Kamptonema formosum TaxID=331992 RepID=UPI0012DD2A17|nr:hypothetical protein [Oscillatoria sp. PCC 10802]
MGSSPIVRPLYRCGLQDRRPADQSAGAGETAGASETGVPVPARGGRAGYSGFKSLQLEYLGFVGGSL